jgi:tripartite-type tricarboxylate transporter receptor subunit TctC
MLGGKAAQFEAARLQWIGGVVSSNGVVFTWHTSPTKTIADAKLRETPMGSAGTNSDSHIFPTLINNLLGTRFRTVNGYTGGARDIHLAIERGEVEGRGGATWAGMKSSQPSWLAENKLNVLVQIGIEPDAELKHVPRLSDLVTTDEDRRAVSVVTVPTELGFAYWLAPEVPAARIALLRQALDALATDSVFLADAEKQQLLIRYKSGAEIEALVKEAATLPKAVLERTARLLEWK